MLSLTPAQELGISVLSTPEFSAWCPSCALRHVGVVPPHEAREAAALFKSLSPPPAVASAAAAAAAGAAPPASPCPACQGLLALTAAVRVESLTVASGSTVCARMEQGGGSRHSKAGIGAGARAPAEVGGVVDCALRYVASSGFDLRDGINLRMNISTAFAAADAKAGRAFLAAFASAARSAGGGVGAGTAEPPLRAPACAMEVREMLRAALEGGLRRLAHRGLPRGAVLLTIEEAAALLDGVESGDALGAGGCGRGSGGGDGSYGAPFAHPAMVALQGACLALPQPPDPRAVLRLAHEACEAAFSAPPPHSAPFPATVRVGGGVEIDSSCLWVSLGSLGEGAGGEGARARLSAAGGAASLREAARGSGGGGAPGIGCGGSASPTALPLPLPPAPAADCALLAPTLCATASLALSVEAVLAPGGVGADAVLSLSRAPLFVKGRYLKLARGLSQTPWFLNGARKDLAGGGDGDSAAAVATGESSVEEHLGFPISARVAAAYAGRGVVEGCFPGGGGGGELEPPPAPPSAAALAHAPLFTFHSAGREDVDVRMLGRGRPFAIELNACRPALLPVAEFARMAALINGGAGGAVAARGVRPASKREFEALAKGADTTRKEYAAVVWSEAPFATDAALCDAIARGLGGAVGSGAPPLALAQRTPIRVLHRRSLLTRKKAIFGGAALRLGDHFFLLHVTTSAGTYVKEFVHGDFGRTQPCLGVVLGGGHCDILALDVVGHKEGVLGEDGDDGKGGGPGE
jgi:tRNA pseudouridine(54/55) synthase